MKPGVDAVKAAPCHEKFHELAFIADLGRVFFATIDKEVIGPLFEAAIVKRAEAPRLFLVAGRESLAGSQCGDEFQGFVLGHGHFSFGMEPVADTTRRGRAGWLQLNWISGGVCDLAAPSACSVVGKLRNGSRDL